jgi:hypothetical protein
MDNVRKVNNYRNKAFRIVTELPCKYSLCAVQQENYLTCTHAHLNLPPKYLILWQQTDTTEPWKY